MKKAILCYPFNTKNPDEMCVGQAIFCELEKNGYDVKKISLSNEDGSYKETAKDVYDLIESGFDASFVIVSDYGPWPGKGWNKLNFPKTLLVYEAGDEPQSMYHHLMKSMQSDLILTPDARNHSLYKDVFKKNSVWWPQFAMNLYVQRPEVEASPICVTTCGDDRGPATKHMRENLRDLFVNKRIWKSQETHADFLGSGQIVFQESTHKEITRRIMEGAALGRLVLTDRLPNATFLNELFVEGEEIILYDSKEDAVEKARYYLKNPELCKKIGAAARKRVMLEHTCEKRVKKLLQHIEESL